MAISGAEVIDLVLKRLDETISPIFWTRPEMLLYLNEGMKELNNLAAKLHLESGVVTDSTDNFYAPPTDTIAVMAASVGDKSLERVTLEDLDREDRFWEGKTGTILKRWAPIGCNLFAIFPRPTVASSVTVDFVVMKLPASIEDNNDAIDMDDEFIESIEDYTFHISRFKEGGPEFAHAMAAFKNALERMGDVARKVYSQQPVIWTAEPALDTGPSYSTPDRGR
jgi:hypothetical protein